MRNRRIHLAAAAVCVLGLSIATALAFWPSGTTSRPDEATTLGLDGAADDPNIAGSRLPKLSLATFDGELKDIAATGRPLVINFWSSTCPPCLAEMPEFEAVYLENAGRVDFIGVNSLDLIGAARARVEQTGVTYPVLQDPKGKALELLGGSGLPRTVVVDGNGVVVASTTGAVNADELRAFITKASIS